MPPLAHKAVARQNTTCFKPKTRLSHAFRFYHAYRKKTEVTSDEQQEVEGGDASNKTTTVATGIAKQTTNQG